jgi:acetyl-CoA carboxylase carboxyl transferase subunit beta
MAWFKKARKPIAPSKEKPSRVPEGLWVKCPGCSQVIYNKDLTTNLNVCPKCAHHFRIGAADRLRMLFDGETWVEHDVGLVSTDPLAFTDTKPYKARLKATIAATGAKDAVVVATGAIDGIETVVAAMEYAFIGGSMGVVVGEKIARGIERAIARRSPVVIVCSMTRGPAKPMSAVGSAMFRSPSMAKLAVTPPVVGSVSTAM